MLTSEGEKWRKEIKGKEVAADFSGALGFRIVTFQSCKWIPPFIKNEILIVENVLSVEKGFWVPLQMIHTLCNL